MASAMTVCSVLDWSPEKSNRFKLQRLIVDGGTEALRNVFKKCHPGKSIQTVLAAEQPKLFPLKGKFINQAQWDELYPTSPNTPDIDNFDITLLSILLRNTCSLTKPAKVGVRSRMLLIILMKLILLELSCFAMSYMLI